MLLPRSQNLFYPEQKLPLEKVDSYPLVTVVIPSYNRSSLIQQAIASVLAQTYTHLELIIADDGSEDDTKQIVRSIKDPRVHLLELPHTGHIGKVRNAGANAGKGEWIAFLDSDDQWLPEKLEMQMSSLQTNNRRWCYTNFELMDETGKSIPPKAGSFRAYSGSITEQLLSNEATVVVCTLLLERKLFSTTGGFSTDERLKLRGDYEFALRLSMMDEAVALPDILVRVLEHPGRVTHSIKDAHERSAVPYIVFLEQHADKKLGRIAKQRKAYLLAEAAVDRSAAGELRMAAGQLVKAMGRDSWRHWLSAACRSVKVSLIKPKEGKINQVI